MFASKSFAVEVAAGQIYKRHWWQDMGRFTLVLNWQIVSFSAKNAHHKVHSIHFGLPEMVHNG